MSIQLVLIGHNTIAREGLARILNEENFVVVASVSNPDEPLLAERDGDGDGLVILIDVNVKGSRYEILANVRHRFMRSRIVVLAESFDFGCMVQCFKSGADGYLVKEIACTPLAMSLRLIAQGEKVLPSHLADYLPDQSVVPLVMDGEQSLEQASLSDREQEVLRCLMVGYPNKVISRHLHISEATVKVHVKAILRKLRVANRTQAAIWASGRVDRMDEGIRHNAA